MASQGSLPSLCHAFKFKFKGSGSVMDLNSIIQGLHAEKERLENLISTLEALSGSDAPRRGKRGRKSMGPLEREEVSTRMRNYWAGRRENRTNDRAGVAGRQQASYSATS